MDADLTCMTCQGTGWHCRACAGSGRRRPTLAEWDALRAERDRYRDALERIDGLPYMPHGQAEVDARQMARAALDAKEGT